MHTNDWIQLALYVGLLALITKPMGHYLFHVLDANGKTLLDPILKPLERGTYALMGVRPDKEHNWKQYTFAMLIFSVVGCLFTYAILRLQYYLPLNPQKLPGVPPDLAFNTAMSFTTNTNWQNYGGESTMSYFSQMVALAIHNFTSAATGIAIAAAVVRGIAKHTASTLGNFWVDLVRTTYYLLLPICLVFAVFLVSQGMIQNFKANDTAKMVEPMETVVGKVDADNNPVTDNNPVLADRKQLMEKKTFTDQTIPQGPVASQVAIKMLGTNGGGYFNANASHPFENPTPLSNFIQMLSIFAIGSGLTYYLGLMTRNRGHGWAVCQGQPYSSVAGSRCRRRQHGREGSALWHLQLRPVRHHHHRRFLRCCEQHA
jgi:K+-transporting ATPase ATPase A chain